MLRFWREIKICLVMTRKGLVRATNPSCNIVFPISWSQFLAAGQFEYFDPVVFARGKLRFSHILSFTSPHLPKPVASSFSKTLPLRGDPAYITQVCTDISDKNSL